MAITDEEVIDIKLHPYQYKAYTSNRRVVCLVSGIQGGKTRTGGLWLARQTAFHQEKDAAFILASPDYKILNQSSLPWFLHVFKGCGTYHKADQEFRLNSGGTVYIRSMVDPDSIEGITNVKAIWADEAGKMKRKAWVNIQGRAAFKEAPIMLTTTPYALNWLYKEVYEPWKAGHRKDVEMVQFRSIDNPYFPKDEYERQKILLDPRVFKMKYGGTFEAMEGLVYPDFDLSNIAEPFKCIPERYHIIGGVDIGYENPFAVTVRAIGYGLGHRKDYQIAEFYKTMLGPAEKTEVLKQMQKVYKIDRFYVDSAHPDMISMFNSAGLTAIPVPKPKGSVEAGIEMHSEIIRTKKYQVFKGKCPYTEDEYSTYHYAEVKEGEQEVKEKPVPVKDHLMDANRYVTYMTRHLRDSQDDSPDLVKTRLQRLVDGEFSKKQSNGDWYYD
jgi:PBSX family phage terminase large subunit